LALRQDGDSRQLQSLHADVLVGFSNMVHAREYANIEALQLKFQAFEIHRQMMRENPTVSSSRQIRDLIAMGELARELKELELKDYRQISDDGEAALRRACDACDRVYRSHPIALSAAAHYALSQFLRYRNDSARDDRRQSLAELETTIRIREAINSNDPMQRMWLLTARLDAARQKGDAAAGERLAADMLVFAPQLPGAQAYAAWLRLQLATFQAAQGHNSAAEATFAAALEQLHGEMEQGLARHAATRQLQVLRTVRCSLDYYCSFHRRAGCLGEKTYAQVLMWKGSLFERQRAERAADESRQAPASQPVPADEPRAAESAAKLCAMLPENAALLDFIRYVDFLPPTNEAGAKNKGTLRYLAFVLRHDGLTAFDLGPADPIEKAVRQWREGRRFAPQDALRVRDMVLPPPLRQKLAGARLLLISPDAILSALPFAALPESDDPREGYLIEHMAIANVLAPKLFRPAASSAGTAAANHISALLVGAVDYGRATPSATTSAAEIRGRRLRFDALDSTGAEIENLRGTFMAMAADTQVETLAGAAATPLAFCRDAVGKRFIHIATHGYCTADLKTFSPVGGLVDVEPGSMPTIVDPGSRTGLALAGANLTPAPDDDSAEHGGLLTAAQVADLDLRGTDLVVLSACDTALGSPVAGEGLLGLQRAFQIGGSRAVVASLWPVGDQSTATLMGIMYRKLLQEHREPILALRDAQLAILNMNQSPAAAERGAVPGAARTLASSTIAPDRRPSPAIWAPWVLSGDPGDLNVILHQLESPIPPARALPHVANHKWNSAFITDAVVCAAVIVMLAGIMMARRARRASRR
jgi:CHAT domain-containing protein